MAFYTGGSERLTILGSGNVGIGATNPASLFSVGSTSQFRVNSSGTIAAATGINSSGNITFSDLSSVGIVHNSATGLLSTSFIVNSDITDGTIDLAAKVTGTLPIGNGGTGAISLTGILKGNGASAFSTVTGTQWGAAYWSDANTIASTFSGTTGQVLTANTGAAPAWQAPVTATYTASACGSDVTMNSAGTWYTGTSVSLTTGTWLLVARITLGKANSTADVEYARIWDGSTAYASGQAHNPGVNPHASTITMSAIVTLASTTTLYVQGTSSVNWGLIKAAITSNGQGNNATAITAVKIAP